jgi:hypothetical protein
MIRPNYSLPCITLTLLLWLPLCSGAKRGPSTPEERQRVASISHRIEADPLGPSAVEDRAWAMKLLIAVPDIHVRACGELMRSIFAAKKNYSSELFAQMIISDGAFAIEQPEKTGDLLAHNLAGLEGSLKAYESILKSKPAARWPLLDELIQKRNNGTLLDYVRAGMGKCNKGAKVSTP